MRPTGCLPTSRQDTRCVARWMAYASEAPTAGPGASAATIADRSVCLRSMECRISGVWTGSDRRRIASCLPRPELFAKHASPFHQIVLRSNPGFVSLVKLAPSRGQRLLLFSKLEFGIAGGGNDHPCNAIILDDVHRLTLCLPEVITKPVFAPVAVTCMKRCSWLAILADAGAEKDVGALSALRQWTKAHSRLALAEDARLLVKREVGDIANAHGVTRSRSEIPVRACGGGRRAHLCHGHRRGAERHVALGCVRSAKRPSSRWRSTRSPRQRSI